ncbi:MAG: RNA-binding domain-containing protein [Candidatus Bathyarchaeia archaeon]|nr:hypothetical protein [Candidatus Bathyarchaeota archaeon A05DMB-4]MDH7595294.1 RNA-binding domain-containing protein [Candidatus Bathyarchaeota archaeon]
MGQNLISYIDIRVFSHATEDENKVMEAVKKILPSEFAEEIAFEKHDTRGHHGNPITFFETRIKDKKILGRIVEKFSSNLNTLDKENLRRSITTYTEKGSLYVRLDKQAAFNNEFKLAQADPIHVRIRFKKQDITETCRELGIIS